MIDYLRSFPDQLKSSFIITFVLCVVILIVGLKVKKVDPKSDTPKWLVPFIMLIELINNFTKENIGRRWKYYAPYFVSLALFLFFSNISAIFCLKNPTSYLMINAALAVITFFIVQTSGILSLKIGGYLKSFVGPVKWLSPIMIPINVIGEFTLPMSLTLRLLGNIVSGSVISLLITGLLGYFAIPFLPFLNMIFDLAFGVIQAFVFVALTIIFTSLKIDDDEKVFE